MSTELAKKVLEVAAWKAYGAWLLAFLPAGFVLLVIAIVGLANQRVIIASGVTIGVVAFGYISRVALIRNLTGMQSKLLAQPTREECYRYIHGGLIWGILVTLAALIACFVTLSSL